MSNVFFIGDTHFGHRNIIRFDANKVARPFNTIEEHDEELVKRWNEVVRDHDTVWHLGDVAFGKATLDICRRLRGRKKLIMGNHDSYPTARYLEHFSQVYGAFATAHFLLTHVPVHQRQLERDRFGMGNIHGHLHTNRVMREVLGDGRDDVMRLVPDERYVCVSVEQTGLRPISLDEVKQRRGKVD